MNLRRRLGHLDGRRILRSTAKFAAASLAMGVAAGFSYSVSFFGAVLLKAEGLASVIRRVGRKLLPAPLSGK